LKPPAPAADAIVVLGCRLRPGGGPSGQLRRRVALGVRLYESGVAPILLLSGGSAEQTTEAAAMRLLAVAAGVPDEALLCEERSRNTVENAIEAARLLGQRGLGRVVLVSHRPHLPRARLLFRWAGLSVVGSAGVPPGSAAAALAAMLYEALALPRSVLRMLLRRGAR
jgi:uncharacterized SAM-binding protein YcdF (DUF218 family)